jgi:hypothetical protein
MADEKESNRRYIYVTGWWDDRAMNTIVLTHHCRYSVKEFQGMANKAVKQAAASVLSKTDGPIGAGDIIRAAVGYLKTEHGFKCVKVTAQAAFFGGFPLSIVDAKSNLAEAMGYDQFAAIINQNQPGC